MQVAIAGVLVDGTSPVTKTPTQQNWNAPQGVDTTITLVVTGSNGTATNLTGYQSVTLKLKNAPANGPSVATTVAALAGALTSPTTGTVTFTLPGAQTKGLNGNYVYDVFTANTTGLRDEVVPPSFVYFAPAPGA